MGEFIKWFEVTHPDAEATIQYVSETEVTAESLPILLQYVDEFVAQSDAYPLTEPVPEPPGFGGPLE